MHSCLIIILKTSVTVWEADLWPGCTWWPRRAPPCSRPSPWPCKHLDFRSDAGWAHPSPSGSGRWPEPRRRGPPGTWCYWCRPVGKELSADSNWMEGKDESTRTFFVLPVPGGQWMWCHHRAPQPTSALWWRPAVLEGAAEGSCAAWRSAVYLVPLHTC